MRAGTPCQFFFLIILLTACGPFGPVPGNQIGGQLTSAPTGGWSFSDDFWTIELEVNSADPYSVNVWCIAASHNLYVAAGRGGSAVWARALLHDAEARVRIGEALFEVSATRVMDPVEIEAYIAALSMKHPSSSALLSDFQAESDRPAAAILFRLDPR
jgi:hypothetical protein